jgi:hypothetical protein
MRKLIVGAALTMCAAPAFAGTLQEVTTRGIIMAVSGVGDVPVTYKPDGTFSANFQGNAIAGKWRIDGDKLCTSSNFQPNEECSVYPKDKKSGDTFQITGPNGATTIKIR